MKTSITRPQQTPILVRDISRTAFHMLATQKARKLARVRWSKEDLALLATNLLGYADPHEMRRAINAGKMVRNLADVEYVVGDRRLASVATALTREYAAESIAAAQDAIIQELRAMCPNIAYCGSRAAIFQQSPAVRLINTMLAKPANVRLLGEQHEVHGSIEVPDLHGACAIGDTRRVTVTARVYPTVLTHRRGFDPAAPAAIDRAVPVAFDFTVERIGRRVYANLQLVSGQRIPTAQVQKAGATR